MSSMWAVISPILVHENTGTVTVYSKATVGQTALDLAVDVEAPAKPAAAPEEATAPDAAANQDLAELDAKIIDCMPQGEERLHSHRPDHRNDQGHRGAPHEGNAGGWPAGGAAGCGRLHDAPPAVTNITSTCPSARAEVGTAG